MSMYRFVKDNTSGSNRLFVQGATTTSGNNPQRLLGPPIVTDLSKPTNNLQAIHTHKRLSTEVLGSSIESTKTSRKGHDGLARITTRIVRKVTTLTRGEEQSVTEDLTKQAEANFIIQPRDVPDNVAVVNAKRVKVS